MTRGRVVGQHDPARAHSNGGGPAGDMSDEDGGRRACDSGHIVVLREPVAVIPPALRVLREVERVAKCLGGRPAFDDGREIEHRKWNHGLPAARNW